jgi:nucleotide-binding universal stress UspA family protein
MKTILVPIDFSPCADNALRYAIQVAKKIKADIHICHAIMVPELTPMGGLIVWPPYESETLLREATDEIIAYAKKVITEEDLGKATDPSITYSCEAGTVKDVMHRLYEKNKIDLVIMGMSGNGDLKRLFIGSSSRDLIEQTNIPILLIPKSATFKTIKKIALATDLSQSDINTIQNIARLFSILKPEILLAHINGYVSDFHDPGSESHKFLNSVTCKVNYPKIYYRHIQQKSINDGLLWLTEKGQVEILAMVHRHQGLFAEITNASHTQKMAKIITIPLLVMPEEDGVMGW